MFKVENITKRFNETTIPLHGLSAQIEKGDIISLIGPSGTGKIHVPALPEYAGPTHGGKDLL